MFSHLWDLQTIFFRWVYVNINIHIHPSKKNDMRDLEVRQRKRRLKKKFDQVYVNINIHIHLLKKIYFT